MSAPRPYPAWFEVPHMRKAALWSCLFAAVSAIAVSMCSAQEWTRFRGPNGTGESETSTIPASWKPGEENWRIELPGIGHSSPVLWGDKIFSSERGPENVDA